MSREWITPLHHVSLLSSDRATELLRQGADVNACANPRSPTPLQLAAKLGASSHAASIVLRSSEAWSVANHRLHATSVRSRALELLLVGHLLSSESRFEGCSQSVMDVWVTVVMPHALQTA